MGKQRGKAEKGGDEDGRLQQSLDEEREGKSKDAATGGTRC